MPLDGRLAVAVDHDAVEFAFTVANADTEPVELAFPSGKTADVAVLDDGIEVWRWSEGPAFTRAPRRETLGPGESFTHEATWEEPRPGTFTAEATIAATNRSLSARAPFEV